MVKDIVFFIYLISLLVGNLILWTTFLFYRLYHKQIIIRFFYFILSLVIILFSLTIQFYQSLFPDPSRQYLGWIIGLTNRLGIFMMIYSLPAFFHSLFNLSWKGIQKSIFLGLITLGVVSEVIFWVFKVHNWRLVLIFPLFVSIFIYSFIIFFMHSSHIAYQQIKTKLRQFFLLSSFFFPLILLENFRIFIPFFNQLWIFEVLTLPFYFILIFPLFFQLIFVYLKEPAYFINNQISDFFITKFQITSREKEVLERILVGDNYQKIADQLFISYKTVDTHIQNIYRKTEVKNKLQLLNLIITNR
ncbi:MAG: helix-turn-helix transcriptional regulator [Spirochaetes bacterium]|nr:helix-turn-helix transcriptional regulator [Spirochaetota bacterium]